MNAIVTGATKGMGRAIVMELAANNYNIIFCARDENEVQALQDELRKSYHSLQFFGMRADMEDSTGLRKFAEFAESSLGHVDVLINNAGLYIPSGIMEEDERCLERQMQVNFFAPHFLSKFFAAKMIGKGKGHIINICSTASLEPVSRAGSYSISKMALFGLTKALREELRPAGVKVTAVLPGSTLTDSWTGTSLPSDWFILSEDIAKTIMNCLQMSSGANIDEIIIRPLYGKT
ncbi:MAG: SDR family oxidoreductase [Daejeonella sp.]|uniref:SDR family NAD(P)-dependent oxidoreductase n=1 Tax=Daejeonella sp. TaxID=2805397 RepID=UPI002733BFFA|nr:SDR family oxidoreductase [Daejeonella sp.]MDP3468766.1 SDR family oxidoreductase [Daejeonella sp.]